MRPRLSAAMIVRDEEKFLGACLESISPHVDEIVIFDTGSRDSSIELARAHGATIYKRAWVNDFAAARNWAIDAASGEWILYIDADERLTVPPGYDVKTLLANPQAVAVTVRFQSRLGFTPYRELRVFRNHPGIRFKGVIHESIHRAIQKVASAENLVLEDTPLSITHWGYEGDLDHKRRRNLPLLLEAVRADPRRVYYWQELAEIYAAFGKRDEAIAACRKAASIVRADQDPKQRADAALAFHTLARFQLDDGEDALPTIDEGLEIYPGHRVLLFLRAKALIERGQCEAALAILEKLTAEDAETFYDPLVAYDKRIFGELAHQLSGVALLRLGQVEDAASAFERAAAAAPDDLGHRSRATAIRAMAERAPSAADRRHQRQHH
jgi:tetratricopeptide (TPR) repeat protein